MKKNIFVKTIMSMTLVGTLMLSSIAVYAQNQSGDVLHVSETTATYDAADFADLNVADMGSSDTYIQQSSQNREVFSFIAPEELSVDSFDDLESAIVSENTNAGEKSFDAAALKNRILEKNAELAEQDNLTMSRAASAYTPDSYEPNNDFNQAFPYNSTVKMTGNAFSEGYVAAGIHDENDVDVYSITLGAGTDYFFSLKNLYHDYDLAVFSPDLSSYWANMYYGTTAESFYINAPTTGTYYVVIFGNGMPEYFHYFFKAVKAVQTKYVTLPSGLTFNFNGAGTTSYLAFDTRSLIPSNAVLNTVYIDSNGSGYWYGLTKYLRASNGSVYSNQDRSGLDYINYPTKTQYAAQLWGIAGKVYEPTTFFTWKPNVSMEYTYVEVE